MHVHYAPPTRLSRFRVGVECFPDTHLLVSRLGLCISHVAIFCSVSAIVPVHIGASWIQLKLAQPLHWT